MTVNKAVYGIILTNVAVYVACNKTKSNKNSIWDVVKKMKLQWSWVNYKPNTSMMQTAVGLLQHSNAQLDWMTVINNSIHF